MCRSILLSFLLAALAGCAREQYQFAPVSGRILDGGKPVANAVVSFSPVAPAGSKDPGPGSTGKTDAEGRYTLTVIGKGIPGALVGKHVVIISRGEAEEVFDSADDRPRKFRKIAKKERRERPRTFEILSGGIEHADFDLKDTK